jgi:hypothetical protein
MINKKRYDIEKVRITAEKARQYSLEYGCIDKNQRGMDEKNLRKIIELFGGEFKISEEEEPSATITKIGDGFCIEYTKKASVLQILHELGHALLHLDDMEEGETLHCNGIQDKDTKADFFAREYLMPRDIFEIAVIDNLNNDGCDIQNIATDYGISYIEALARGVELKIWK